MKNRFFLILSLLLVVMTSCYERTDGIIGDFFNSVFAIFIFVVVIVITAMVVKGSFDDKDKNVKI